MKSFSNLNISCKVVFSLNNWNKKVGSPSSFRRKRPFISMNSSASIESLSKSERARARARANHAKNDAQKGCAMQLNGITLKDMFSKNIGTSCYNLRTSREDIALPRARTGYYRNSFAFTGAKIWNSLPNDLKCERSLESFKNKLKSLNLCIDF